MTAFPLTRRGLVSIDVAATSDTTIGSVVTVGSVVGFALSDAKTGERFAVCVECPIVRVSKGQVAFSPGDRVFANATGDATKSISDSPIGYAHDAAAEADDGVNVWWTPITSGGGGIPTQVYYANGVRNRNDNATVLQLWGTNQSQNVDRLAFRSAGPDETYDGGDALPDAFLTNAQRPADADRGRGRYQFRDFDHFRLIEGVWNFYVEGLVAPSLTGLAVKRVTSGSDDTLIVRGHSYHSSRFQNLQTIHTFYRRLQVGAGGDVFYLTQNHGGESISAGPGRGIYMMLEKLS